MTNQEFSDAFTTMLNSFSTQAQFGEQASKMEIVLDEYEKSIFLTQAQDIVVKSYFDRTLNTQSQGFDDSTRRQIDFSSLIKVVMLSPTDEGMLFDDRGIMFKMPRKLDTEGNPIEDTTDVLFILNEKLCAYKISGFSTHYYWHNDSDKLDDVEISSVPVGSTLDDWALVCLNNYMEEIQSTPYNDLSDAEANGWEIRNGQNPIRRKLGEYTIVPINYKEYDREMVKPYAQPLKKQAWRLFQNSATGFDFNSELIPKFNITPEGDGTHVDDIVLTYKIRYVRRPNPIVLEDLPNNLEIDGVDTLSECELNPILHMDILNKAVELALVTRGKVQPQQYEKRRE